METFEETVALEELADAEKDKEKEKSIKVGALGFSHATSIAVVFSYWKDFDLENERSKLDEQGLQIGENQEASLKNRRKLAESTRDFKKASMEDKQKLFHTLIKAFQEEVDNLTKRAKSGENAFLAIYQKLYEAPDPVPALASATDLWSKVTELESDNRKMKHELEEYRTEAAHLRNQQATVRRLEERNRQLEQQMEEKIKEIVEMKQRTLAEENQKMLEVLKDREQSLQDQLRVAKETVQNMQRLHDYGQSQLFEFRAQSDEERAAKQAELNLLTDEVERAQTRLLSLEREKEQLRSQLQVAHTPETQVHERQETGSSTLEASLIEKEKKISELHAELNNLEMQLSLQQDQHLAELKRLNALVIEKMSEIEELQKHLEQRPTTKQIEDLRKQVKILQAVGYNSIEAEDWELATTGEDMTKLEALLLDKNRKMEHELTQLKVQLAERVNSAEASQAKIKELEMNIEQQQELITKLEEDILTGYNSLEKRANKADDWDLTELGASDMAKCSTSNPDKGKQAVRAVRVSKVVSALMLIANTNVSVPVNLSNQVLSLLGFVGKHPLNVLVDSGCSTNFVSTTLVSKLRLPTQQSVEAFQVELADGSYLQCNKKVQQLEFQVEDYQGQLGFSVMPLSHYDMILGQSWLFQYDPIISFRDHSIRLFHRNQEVELRGLFNTQPITMVFAMQVKRLVRKTDCTTALVMLCEAEDDTEEYADDTLLFLHYTPDVLDMIRYALEMFCVASGARINYDKSYGVLAGLDVSREQQFSPVMQAIRRKLCYWSTRHLSMAGRALVANQVLLASAWYVASCWTMHGGVMLQLRRLIRNFLFGGSDGSFDTRPRGRWSTCILPTSQGGLGIIDLEIRRRALLTKVIVRGLFPGNEPWTMLLQSALATTITPTYGLRDGHSGLQE
ncbi:hypothetical protein L7F22_037020 [Adiantum nelumboides]|nr:hypothetical protein [Adiantum nelumboides]